MKIYAVEDDENIRELVLYALEASGFEAEGFECSQSFFSAIECSKPDIVLLDIMLPDENGLQILKKLRQNSKTAAIPVIMLTAKAGEMDKVKCLDIGADDYITKPFSVLELVSRIRAVLRRTSGESLKLSAEGIEIDTEKHTVAINNENISLTFKEFELLKLLMSNCGIVFSREKLMNRIWGTDYEGESRTVDMHIKTLRKKLGDFGEAIKTIRNVGYKFGD